MRYIACILWMAIVPIGVLFDPVVVPTGVVRHPIENDLHAQVVDLFHQRFELLHRPEFRVHLRITGYGVITTQRPLALGFTDRENGHEP